MHYIPAAADANPRHLQKSQQKTPVKQGTPSPGLPPGPPPLTPQELAKRAEKERELTEREQALKVAAEEQDLIAEQQLAKEQALKVAAEEQDLIAEQQLAKEQALKVAAEEQLAKEQALEQQQKAVEAAQRAAEPKYPLSWTAESEGQPPRAVVTTDAELWSEMQARVDESLPDFDVVQIRQVENHALWRGYTAVRSEATRKKKMAAFECSCFVCSGSSSDERRLFHYAQPEVIDKIWQHQTAGFDPRLCPSEGKEYGAGAYFAEHAIYSVAYGNDWLHGDFARERDAPEQITLLVGKVCLDHCKDFGPRCRSHRGDKFADALDKPRKLLDWGGEAGKKGDAMFNRPPPHAEAGVTTQVERLRIVSGGRERGYSEASMTDDSDEEMAACLQEGVPPEGGGEGAASNLYASVTGTEADLTWTKNPRIRTRGKKFGRQFVTFETNQAYPELILDLRRRGEKTKAFERAREQELRGKGDLSMQPGTELYSERYGRGVYQQFVRNDSGPFNQHMILLNEYAGEYYQTHSISLADPAEQWHVTAAPRQRPELIPNRMYTQLDIKGRVDIAAQGSGVTYKKRHIQYVLFVSTPVLDESAKLCTVLRKRWSQCEEFSKQLEEVVNAHLDTKQRFVTAFPKGGNSIMGMVTRDHGFDPGELDTRQQQLDEYFKCMAQWVSRLCADRINLFDSDCQADPDCVVINFFSGAEDPADSTKYSDLIIKEQVRRTRWPRARGRRESVASVSDDSDEEGVPPEGGAEPQPPESQTQKLEVVRADLGAAEQDDAAEDAVEGATETHAMRDVSGYVA
eukprot:COSAG06_NODE_775_length_12397_cov_15.034071_5_plen_801_part_00